MNSFRVLFGDPSNDGHGRYEEFVFECNFNKNQLEQVFKKAQKDSGVSFDKILYEYEDNSINENLVEKLEDFGIKVQKIKTKWGSPEENDDCSWSMDPESTLLLILEMIKIQDPEFQYIVINKKLPEVFKGIGYGLFN